MKTKNIEKEIIKLLSENKDIWYLKGPSDKNTSFNSLFDFLSKIEKNFSKIIEKEKIREHEISYNRSINHFLLYYSYYPRFPILSYIDETLIFASFIDRNFSKIELSLPIYKNPSDAIENLSKFLSNSVIKKILKKQKIEKITIRDIDDKIINSLKKKKSNLKINSLREIRYGIYDIKKSIELSGKKFSNLRWHLNNFEKDDHEVREVNLENNIKPVIHLIGKWRKDAIEKRDFSYVNMRSDKLGARFFGKNYNSIQNHKSELVDFSKTVTNVLKVDGEIASFNLGFPLGIYKKQNVFAHSIGISDVNIPHLSEFSQFLFWKKIKNLGYKYINDGPTWKKDLEIYKNKFKPYKKKRYYYADILLN